MNETTPDEAKRQPPEAPWSCVWCGETVEWKRGRVHRCTGGR